MNSIDFKKLSPMMKQYVEIKNSHKNHLLFFRLGDFYELFFDDAIVVSKELEIVLTGKECGLNERAPMCGIPYHSVGPYIKKLIDKGFKVAICEQVERINSNKNLVDREVVRVITPGTVIESDFLNSSFNNYICSIFLEDLCFCVCFCDISTGILQVTQINSKKNSVAFDIINELDKFLPSEILYSEQIVNLKEVSSYLTKKLKCVGCLVSANSFDIGVCKQTIKNQFSEIPIEILNSEICLKSVNMLLTYLNETQKQGIKRLVNLVYYNSNNFLKLDYFVRKNLELTQTLMEGKKQKSLLWVVDKTKTAMGKRLMRKIVEQPLVDVDEIVKRQNAVEALNLNLMVRDEIIEILSHIFDLERLMTKIIYNSINAREIKSFAFAISKLSILKEKLKLISNVYLESLNSKISDFSNLSNLIFKAIVDEPPVNFKDGGTIATGFNSKLDELRKISENSRNLILELELKEREKTGINKLKVKFNKVFGYFLEVNNSFLNKVPQHYIRKQTISSGERFITPELKELEYKILEASELSLKIEMEIFEKIKKIISEKLLEIQIAAQSIALIDVLTSFSVISIENRYIKPVVDVSDKIEIKNGRHPVIELISNDYFIANDTNLNCDDSLMMLITGPNMAGKSTYMRQVALITIMAQIGCFVPADFARIGVVDRIFTRIGAYDDLTSGKSTFMMEMSEVSKILQRATNKSLIIFDEIGRGTSTFDGLSIAKSIAEYVLNQKKLHCKTLFATHYHELVVLEDEFFGVKNYCVDVKNYGDKVSFLRKIVRGCSNDSFGLVVAKLAGLPDEVIDRANCILKEIENKSVNVKKNSKSVEIKNEDKINFNLIDKLKKIVIEQITPIEAFNFVCNLKNELDSFLNKFDIK